MLSRGADQFQLTVARRAELSMREDWPTWIESVWVDPGGLIFAFYHQEDFSNCGGRLASPRIGALVSYDQGESFSDLGLILTSPDPADCTSRNGYFATGHGDLSVIADQDGQYLYFFFGNYGGSLQGQGVAMARMALTDRFSPSGKVWKYYDGAWNEPGIRGRATPVFAAKVSWQQADTDSMWGPAIHWNTHLQTYVILMNRACCETGWPQEGVYITFNSNLSNPSGWSEPLRIIEFGHWYPQVIGLGPGETDSLVGQKARFWMFGESEYEIEFYLPGTAPPEESEEVEEPQQPAPAVDPDPPQPVDPDPTPPTEP